MNNNIITKLHYNIKKIINTNSNYSIKNITDIIKQKYNNIFFKPITILKKTSKISILSYKYITRENLIKKTKYIYIGIIKNNNKFILYYENTVKKLNNILISSKHLKTPRVTSSRIKTPQVISSHVKTPPVTNSRIKNPPITSNRVKNPSVTKSSKIPKRKIDYTKYFLSHKIVKKDKLIFIEKSDDSVKSIVKKLLDNTIHISFEVFYTYLLKNVKALLIKHKETKCIYFFIDEFLINKSNYWLSKLIEELINKHDNSIKIKYINTLEDLKTNDLVLFIDDCVYSGIQMADILKGAIKTKKTDVTLRIYLFVSFMTNNGIEYIKTINNNIKFLLCDNVFYITKCTNDYLTKREIINISIMYNFYFNFDYTYLIYFDHKLADFASTIPLFYSGLIPNNHNKDLLKKIPKSLFYNKNTIRTLIANLEYHNFIENCEGINNFDQDEPKCPKPPYKNKEEYKKYVQHINKNRLISSKRLHVSV